MEPISRTGLKGGVHNLQPLAGSNENQFSKKIKLAEAGELLRPFSLYEKWKQLCQNNDTLAFDLAGDLLMRDEILEKSKQGKDADWELFVQLTEKLAHQGFVLFNKNPLEIKNNYDHLNMQSGFVEQKERQNSYLTEILEDKLFIGKLKIIDIDPNKTSISIMADQTLFSPETELVISAEYKQYTLNKGMIAYGNSERIFLPFKDLIQALDFPIHTDPESGSAKGWFIKEDRIFSLDMTQKEVMVGDRKIAVPKDGIKLYNGDLYVASVLLEKWFPVDLEYDFSAQSIKLKPREKLPFQARIEREQTWKNIGGGDQEKTVFPLEKSDYQLFAIPSLDLGLTSSYRSETESNDKLTSNFHILSKGDLGKMTSEIYLSGDDKHGLKNTRLTLRRDDPEGELLGPLKANSVAVGDIRTVKLPIIGGGNTERGLNLSNKELQRSREFDTTFFEGNLPPGWDVEVYRNNMLVDSKRIGAEGKYNFSDISIYYGKNDFKLIFFGPQGQERVETKTINVGNALLKKGNSEYNVSISQKNTSVYNPDMMNKNSDDESLKINASYDYGLAKNLSIGTGISSQEIDGEHRYYLNLGAKGAFKDLYLSGDAIHDTSGGDAVELFAQTELGEIDLRLKQRFYNNFMTKNSSGSSDSLKSQTNISVSGVMDELFFLPDIPFTLTYDESRREESSNRSIGTRLSGNIENVNLNNYLKWSEITTSSDSSSVLNGKLQVGTNLNDFRIRGYLDYKIDPKTEFTSAGISNFYRINDNLSSELSLKKNLDNDSYFSGSLKLNWNNGKYILSPQVSYDSNDVFNAFLSFSTSFGMEPRSKKIHTSSMQMADKGSVSVKVFNDKNYNKVFDEEDEVIKGASVKALQSNKEAETDENGIAFINQLPKNKPNDIVLDTNTLEDPFWEPSTLNRSILPRPGHTQMMDIPIVATGEIDGILRFKTEDGMEKSLSNVLVQLLDDKGDVIQEMRSEYDGFYYFQKVFPGKYSVRIDPKNTQKTGRISDLIKVEIDKQGSIASGNDIFLEKESVTGSKESQAKNEIIADGRGVLPESDIIPDSPVIPLKAESVEVVRNDEQRSTAKFDVLEDIMERDQAQKDYEKLKAEYDRHIELEKKHEDINIAKVSSLKKVHDIDKIKELPGQPRYGLHLSSYRTSEKAGTGIKYLLGKYKGILDESDFSIRKVKVSDEKGIWYRVVAGSFTRREKAAVLGKKIKKISPYCKIVPLNKGVSTGTKTGVHLTSFRTRRKALQNINELKAQYPSILKNLEFTIKNVDLGPKMGKWKRVIVGRFANELDAKSLARKIKMKQPYCKPMEIEKDNEVGVHVASYQSAAKASEGLRQLQVKYASLIKDEDFSIRRTDLGDKKGVWYRIFAGKFSNKESAATLKLSLNKRNQYAMILNMKK